jgi:hypothetical protein
MRRQQRARLQRLREKPSRLGSRRITCSRARRAWAGVGCRGGKSDFLATTRSDPQRPYAVPLKTVHPGLDGVGPTGLEQSLKTPRRLGFCAFCSRGFNRRVPGLLIYIIDGHTYRPTPPPNLRKNDLQFETASIAGSWFTASFQDNRRGMQFPGGCGDLQPPDLRRMLAGKSITSGSVSSLAPLSRRARGARGSFNL